MKALVEQLDGVVFRGGTSATASEECAALVDRYDQFTLPVVDDDGRDAGPGLVRDRVQQIGESVVDEPGHGVTEIVLRLEFRL